MSADVQQRRVDMISINQLTKDYGNHRGIFDVNICISQGEVYGYLGPNGAGKTTTIRHLLGFLNPDHGTCQIDSFDCRTQSAQIMKRTGYLPGEITFMDSMQAEEYLKYLADLRGLKDDHRRKDLAERFDFHAKGSIKKMSKGMKQKIGIISAFMHDPEIYILDEPTSGLDPLMQSRFVDLIREEKKRGKTILMSSHHFEEVEKTCDRVGIIKDGTLLEQGTIEQIKQQQTVAYRVAFATIAHRDQMIQQISSKDYSVLPVGESEVRIDLEGDKISQMVKDLAAYDIKNLNHLPLTLEEVFMKYYQEEQQ